MNYEKLEKQLKKELDNDRFRHTIGVAHTAAALAMRFGYDMDKAYLAGLLHDCAKCISNDKKLLLCEKNKLEVSEIEKQSPFLLHAKLGSFLAKEKYGVEDEEILSAIRWHTTGHAQMTLLEKIIYIADYIEPNRKKLPNLTLVRGLCFDNLNTGLRKILEDSLEYLKSKNNPIDPLTQETYDYYKNIQEDNE